MDDIKGKNKKVDDDLQQAKDSLTEKLDKEIKEVSLINVIFRMSICICGTPQYRITLRANYPKPKRTIHFLVRDCDQCLFKRIIKYLYFLFFLKFNKR